MKFTIINKTVLIAAWALILLAMSSCVKETVSLPAVPANVDPAGLVPTMNLAQFKNLYWGGAKGNVQDSFTPVRITDDIILFGVVNADDRSGNLYKQIIFQDSTGGLQLVADAPDLYNTYPVGTHIFIKCKGLYLFWYLGTLELGGYVNNTGTSPSLGGIPGVALSNYVVKGMKQDTVLPKKFTINQMNNADAKLDQSVLVEVDDVEISHADTNKPYADGINKGFGQITLIDCANNGVTIRSSGYANFAVQKPAKGHGMLLGIFTVFIKSNGTPVNQLTIRDTSDVRMPVSTPRCH